MKKRKSMERRKEVEIEYYDKKAEELLKKGNLEKHPGDFEGFEPENLGSFKFFYELIKKYCSNKIVLDYGCGNGIHSVFPAKMGAKKVIGIDLSEKSLEIAKEKVKREKLGERVEFLLMDCEKMDFPDNFFDLIIDGGTFSSLDLSRAYPELSRVLKPEGALVGIETFGHNPFTNMKRKLNELSGKRTLWAADHIFKMRDLKTARNYFNQIEVKFFHLVSWLAFPLLNLPGGKFLLKLLEEMDSILLKIPFLRKYTFKAAFVFSSPRKIRSNVN